MRVKYPRTLHYPTSPGVQSDDKVASDLTRFERTEVIVTEKMDGENTTLYNDGFHARSVDSGRHPARDWMARFHAERAYLIPHGWRVCGENLYARHAVGYTALPAYFLGFSIWTDTGLCLGWDDTCHRFAQWGIVPVRVLWRGSYEPAKLDLVSAGLDQNASEGWVMRLTSQFVASDFHRSVVKWVRAGHVQTEAEHWSKGPITPNNLA